MSDEQSEFVMRYGGHGAPGPKGETGDQGPRGEGMTKGARHAVVFLFVLSFVLAGTGLYLASRQVSSLRTAVQTQCKFDADLGGAPIALNPANGKPSLLGVTIVSDSRVAWHGLGCPGKLGPPAPSFARWARYYHLPAG